jgi:hypothetical protein
MQLGTIIEEPKIGKTLKGEILNLVRRRHLDNPTYGVSSSDAEKEEQF